MPKQPRDPNQLVNMIVEIATGVPEDTVGEPKTIHPKTQRRTEGDKTRPSVSI